jgi:DNA mismatch repair protein MutS
MKALGVAVVMAQCGMYVPCESMTLMPFQSLFTRISGHDDILRGMSSFTVEMSELSTILKRAGPRSLVLGDEVCRGTETSSACAIVASAIVMLSSRRVPFLFASHLHNLVDYPEIKRLRNVHVYHLTADIDHTTNRIVFDRRLQPGVGKTLYGVNIARHIVQDKEFQLLTERILNATTVTFTTTTPRLVDGSKTSRYNKSLFLTQCDKCGKRPSYPGELHTHHIVHQAECDKEGFYEVFHHKNDRCNLRVLCQECHTKEHH